MSKAPPRDERKALGRRGEEAAAEFLVSRGLRVLDRNRRTPFGELDLICRDKKTVVFVEVKTRSSNAFGRPGEAVGRRKQEKMARAALSVLAEKGWRDAKARFDVVEVFWENGRPEIVHLRDAFDLDLG